MLLVAEKCLYLAAIELGPAFQLETRLFTD
jgi:hypothetical protein